MKANSANSKTIGGSGVSTNEAAVRGREQTRAPAVGESTTGVSEGVISAGSILELDCGCWLGDKRTFGVISGDTAAYGSVYEYQREKEHGWSESDLRAGGRACHNETIDLLVSYLNKNKVITKIVDWRRVVPGSVIERTEVVEEGSFFTKKDEMLVFMPDMHIGLRDAGDDFAGGLLDNMTAAIAFLTTVKQYAKGAGKTLKIIQLGDLYDMWEVEVAVRRQDFLPPQKIDFDNWYENGGYRGDAKVAKMIRTRIENAWSPRVHTLVGLFDVILPGNHDEDLALAGMECLSETYGEAGLNGRVYYCHGSEFSWFNRRSRTFTKADGKWLTFDHYIKELVDPDREHGAGVKFFAGGDVFLTRDGVLSKIKDQLEANKSTPGIDGCRVYVYAHTHSPMLASYS